MLHIANVPEGYTHVDIKVMFCLSHTYFVTLSFSLSFWIVGMPHILDYDLVNTFNVFQTSLHYLAFNILPYGQMEESYVRTKKKEEKK